MKRYFEFIGGSSAKFWEASVSGNEVTVRFGRIGTVGQTQVKTLADANAATTHAEKLIGQKLAKGYRETVVSAIDWPKTAEINGVAVPEPVFVNRIAPVLEPVAV